jgi:hypothetical protein
MCRKHKVIGVYSKTQKSVNNRKFSKKKTLEKILGLEEQIGRATRGEAFAVGRSAEPMKR